MIKPDSLVSEIWPVSMNDADWVIALAEECYGRPLDHNGVREFMADSLTAARQTFFCRSRHAVGVAVLQRPFFDPSILQAHMVYLMARKNHGLAGYRMLMCMTAWAKAMGAASFHFSSATSYDLSVFARRMAALGVKPDQPSWTLDFRNP